MPPRKPIRSPIQRKQLQKPQQSLNDMQQFISMGQELLKARDDMKAFHAEIMGKIGSIQRGPQGFGTPGKSGRDGKDGRDGRDGVSPTVDLEKLARMAAALVPKPEPVEEKEEKEEKKIKADDIEGMSEALERMIQRRGSYIHGGGDTVGAGTNIVITTDASGTKIISALGGTTGKDVVTQYSLTVVASGSDITVDLTQLTNWADFSNIVAVYLNNIPQTETINFTVVGSTLTIFNAADTDIVNVTYAFNP